MSIEEERKARCWVRFWFGILSLFLLAVSVCSCNFIYDRYPSEYWGSDWWGEEAFEAAIESQTGWDLDLSPFDHEDRF